MLLNGQNNKNRATSRHVHDVEPADAVSIEIPDSTDRRDRGSPLGRDAAAFKRCSAPTQRASPGPYMDGGRRPAGRTGWPLPLPSSPPLPAIPRLGALRAPITSNLWITSDGEGVEVHLAQERRYTYVGYVRADDLWGVRLKCRQVRPGGRLDLVGDVDGPLGDCSRVLR